MTFKEEIGHRLKEFGEKNFKTLADFARALGVKPQSMTDYYNGKTTPGNRMKAKLEKLGCNIIWLITGKYPNELQAEFTAREKEEEKIINYLKLKGLDTLEKVEETIKPILKVAEKMEEYGRKKK